MSRPIIDVPHRTQLRECRSDQLEIEALERLVRIGPDHARDAKVIENVDAADELIEAVWRDQLPANPKHALQSAMSRLRKSFGLLSPLPMWSSPTSRVIDLPMASPAMPTGSAVWLTVPVPRWAQTLFGLGS